jgi:hypothetical protein
MSTKTFIESGYFKFVPDFIAASPQLVPWVQAGRLVVLGVLVLGFIQAYKTIKDKYQVELESGKVSIRK